jgi:hypothetical protein
MEPEEAQPQQEAIDTARRHVEAAKRDLETEKRNAARREWGGWLIKIRENPFFRAMNRKLAALALGVPLRAAAVEASEVPAVPEKPPAVSVDMLADVDLPAPERTEAVAKLAEEDVKLMAMVEILRAEHAHKLSPMERMTFEEARYQETDDFYNWQVSEVAKQIEGGMAAPEYYARVGLPEWTPYQRSLFVEAPVGEKFTELHSEYRDLTPEQFLRAYPEMLELARTEFRFSNQYRFLTADAIELFAEGVEKMPPEEALTTYKTLLETIGRGVGFKHVVRLTDRTLERIGPDHPIRAYLAEAGYAESRQLVGPSKNNLIHMDQARGELRVLRKIGDFYLLLDSYPAIGGKMDTPTMSLKGKPAGSEWVHVPDVVMTVSTVDRNKTSWTWQNSWVPQGAPIRDTGTELQYQHPATNKWYDLTGPNAAFFPHGQGEVIQPWDATVTPTDLSLVRAASHIGQSGEKFVPEAWTREDIIKKYGQVPETWTLNDFGPAAIRLAYQGETTGINIHSKPSEEPNDFLPSRTHGCFATFSNYVTELYADYGIARGSTVVVTTGLEYDLEKMVASR